MKTLTAENIEVDMLIQNKENPEWGNWRVLSKYDDRIWDIRGKSGDTTLMQSEFHFWEVVKYVSRNPSMCKGCGCDYLKPMSNYLINAAADGLCDKCYLERENDQRKTN